MYKNLSQGVIVLMMTVGIAMPSSFKVSREVKKEKKSAQDDQIYTWLKTMSEVCTSLRDRHFRSINFEQAFKESLKAMVSTADAHSAFFTPESYKKALESASGEFPGIGISVTYKEPQDAGLVAVSVIGGGPAEKAGLKAKDKMISVDGELLKGLSTDEVIDKLKGKIGTKVKIKVIRDDKEPLEFTVKRDTIKDQSSTAFHFTQHNIYYLGLKVFAENSADQMSAFIKKAVRHKSNGIIIDLRRNPGGVLESAIDVVGLFIKKGSTVVITKDKKHKVIKKYHTLHNPIFNGGMPLFLLIDSFSASAAEIFSGCMRHYSETADPQDKNKLMVFLVGSTTFGKGSVQEVLPVSNSCALKLTTMLYYLPDDTSIQASGITPDFIIKPKMIPKKELEWIENLYGKETSLKGHITKDEVDRPQTPQAPSSSAKKGAALNNKCPEEDDDSEKEPLEERQKKALIQDVQIQACANMINMLKIAAKTSPDRLKTRKDAVAFLKEHFITDEGVELTEIK